MFRIVMLGFLVFAVSMVSVPIPTYAISLDDDEEDAEDVANLLEQAKKAGKNESFSQAEKLLKKAKMYGTSSNDIAETKKYISTKKKIRDERLERKRKERERLARLKREKEQREKQARLAAQSQQSNESSYGLPKSKCYRTSGSYALYQYCNYGSCIYQLMLKYVHL